MIRMEIDTVEEIGGLQYVSGRTMAGERLVRVLRAEAHGTASHPPAGSIGIVMPFGGDRTRMVCLGLETPGLRPTGLGAGHVTVYEGPDCKISLGGGVMTLKATTIVLDGVVKLGGAGAVRELALKDSIDEGGQKIVTDLATKVFGL